MKNPTINEIFFQSFVANRAEAHIVWVKVSNDGRFKHINCPTKECLETLIQSGLLGAFIHKANLVYAAVHEQNAEQFRKVNAGMTIEGKKVEVIALSQEDYQQFMNAAIALDPKVEKKTETAPKESAKVEVKQNKLLLPSITFSKVYFYVHQKLHECVKLILDQMELTREMLKQVEKAKEKKRQEKKDDEKRFERLQDAKKLDDRRMAFRKAAIRAK